MRDCAVSAKTDPGRLYREAAFDDRSPFVRDGDRVVHTTAFRRLTDKTQVWIASNRDHFRTRLTHTIEVSRASRSIARQLRLNPQLAEVIALAHDIGHPPFGHMGESILDSLLAGVGGFNHNAQALQIVTYLSSPYVGFDGLNLSWASLEGIAKHNGPVTRDIPFITAHYNQRHDLRLGVHASCEAQVAALADDIVYNSHDLHDGMRAGVIDLDDARQLRLIGCICTSLEGDNPTVDSHRLRANVIRQTFNYFMGDITKESKRILDENAFANTEEVRLYGKPVIAFSDDGLDYLREISAYLKANLYHSDLIKGKKARIQGLLTKLFHYYLENPSSLPENWQGRIDEGRFCRRRLVGDYIAGMTDRFTIQTAQDKGIVQPKEVDGIM